jgi:uncharacterized membrane protein YraQ (UPF0718 family)
MDLTTVSINIFAVACLIVVLIKDREKAKESLKMAAKSFVKILPPVLIIVIFIGLLLGFVPPSEISRFIGKESGLWGVLIIAAVGAIMYIPSLIAFPLAASLLGSGASIEAVAVFITTLTMIGVVTLPLEIKELGKKIALLRNGISFIVAILIALIMGMML